VGLFGKKQDIEGIRVLFYILVKVCDRPRLVCNFLESLANFLERRPLVDFYRVFLFDDSASTEVEEVVKEKISRMGRLPYEFEFWNWKRQKDFLLVNFSKEQLHNYADFVGDIFSEETQWHHRGDVRLDNIIMLILSLLKRGDSIVSLFCHFEDDESFSVLVPQEDHFYVKEIPFDYFGTMKTLLLGNDIPLASGTISGDPPTTCSSMIRTNLEDCISFFEFLEASGNDPNVPYLPPRLEPEAYAFENMAFYDHKELMGRHRKKGHAGDSYYFRFKKRIPSPTVSLALHHYLRELSLVPFGVHPTRPVLWQEEFYCNPGNSVMPGNYVSRTELLSFFRPMSQIKIARNGPLYGRILNQVIGQKLRVTNLSVLHHRALDHINRPEFRLGVNPYERFTDLTGEILMQFTGDVIIEALERTQQRMGNLLGLVFLASRGRSIFNKEYATAVDRVGQIYCENARKIDEIIMKFHQKRYLTDKRFWWNAKEFKVPMNAVKHLIETAARNWNIEKVISPFISQAKQPEVSESIQRQIIRTLTLHNRLIPKTRLSYWRSLASIGIHSLKPTDNAAQ
jgi:hypothetical protein